MRKGFLTFAIILFFSSYFHAAAAEYTNGSIRLVMNERTGRFSLYYLSENNQDKPLPLFSVQDPRTSFLSVIINGRRFNMGDNSTFRIGIGEEGKAPSFIFESSTMLVTQEFSFIRSANSSVTNGVRITVTIENKDDRQVSSGARFLLDTNLGEGILGFPISTDLRTINSEFLLTGNESDRYWIDRNRRISLAGSIKTGSPEDPDSVHFANWNKLNDASWKAVYQAGRNFNNPPYSMGDTAVCYYFDEKPLNRGEKRSFGFTLFGFEGDTVPLVQYTAPVTAQVPGQDRTGWDSTGWDNVGSNYSGGESVIDLALPEEPDYRAQDLSELRELIAVLNARIASGTATEEEVSSLEIAINKIRAKYVSGN